MYTEIARESEWKDLFVLFVQHLRQHCQSHREGSTATSSNYSSATAQTLSVKATFFFLPSLSLNWTSNLYHLCFPFRLTSNTWFPLDWKQVCWKLSALSSLYNVDCCLAPVWKQLFPSCTYWFWAVKDLSLDFLFLFALLFAASFIKKRLSLYTMPKNQLQLCYLTKLLPHFKARSPLGSFVSVNVPQRIRHSSVLFW